LQKVFVTVKWKSYLSRTVKLEAGVRQGGCLSPYLFAMFVDGLLVKLKQSRLGCHIAGMCCNAVMYADDLLILAISLRDLQLLVNICTEEFDKLDLTVNIKKSMCIRIGKKHNENIAPVVIYKQPLAWVQEIRYLGVVIVSSKSFKCNLQVSRQKYFRALNAIFARIGTKASPSVILSLVRSYCLPVLLYGIEALSINATLMNTLDNAFGTIFAKIFLTFERKIIMNCQFFCGVLPLSYTLDCRIFEFYVRLMHSSNECVKLHFLRTGKKSFERLQKTYIVPMSASKSQLKYVMWSKFASCLNLRIIINFWSLLVFTY